MNEEQKLSVTKGAQLMKELRDRVGFVKCSKCQTTITPDIVNCPLCGEKVN